MLFRSGLQVETLIVSGQAGATSGGGPAPTPRPTTPVADPRRQPPTRDGRVPTDEEQEVRFTARIHDPLKQWKLSPMDVESRRRWEDYTKAKEIMLQRTHIPEAPWWVVQAVDKKKARLNCIHHLLGQISYDEVQRPPVALPARIRHPDYLRGPVPPEMYVPAVY